MTVRLGFAVAAHLQCEIMIVDEVLAVGDSEFQSKCLGKMEDVAKGGKTILFVSHNLSSIQTLCHRGLILQNGRIECVSDIHQAVSNYVRTQVSATDTWIRSEVHNLNSLSIEKVHVHFHDEDDSQVLRVTGVIYSSAHHRPAFVAIDVLDELGNCLMQAIPTLSPFIGSEGNVQFIVRIELPPLIPGSYSLNFWVGSSLNDTLDQIDKCVSFTVVRSPTMGRTVPHNPRLGRIVPRSSIVAEQIPPKPPEKPNGETLECL